jgi:undecaprenyl-phosphate 4-deoxy-4-formamido-L-arabinose transferase
MTLLQLSPLDSSRFGLAVYRGTLAAVDSKALAREIFEERADVAIVRVPTALSSRLQEITRHGLPLIHADTLVYYQVDLAAIETSRVPAPDTEIRRAVATDRGALRDLIRVTFTDYTSHYRANPHFSVQAILEGYVEWGESYLDGTEGRTVWVVRQHGKMVAFATCADHPSASVGEIVLNGVHPQHANRGLYGDLIRHTLADWKARGFAAAKISTQVSNLGVQKVWSREGFVLSEVLDTFHVNAMLGAQPQRGNALPIDDGLERSGLRVAMPSISVVVPVYNSASTLGVLVSRLEAVLAPVTGSFELILVNDGSLDGSWRVISDLAVHNARLRGINLMRNYGQHNALLCGIRAASFPIIVTIDDDLQHPPEEIPKLLAALTDDIDVMYGVPRKQQHGLLRDLASQVTKLALQSAMGADTARHVSAFRVFRTNLRDSFARYRSPFASIDVMLTWGTRRFAHIEVEHAPRLAGVSNYSVRQLLSHAVNMMTGFSVVPLQIASMTGFAFTLFGVGVLAFVLIRYFMLGGSIPGFPFLAAIIAIFAGAQLFSLGVIGEYLARMHFRIMDKPTYVIRDTAGTDPGIESGVEHTPRNG